MKKNFLIVTIFLPVLIFAQHQQKFFSNIHFTGTVGVAGGESRLAPIAQAGGGWVSDHQYIGIGGGFDSYRFNTIPVFADYRFFIGKSNAAFVYGQAGYNFPAKVNQDDHNSSYKTTDIYRGGFYMDAGLGFRIPMGPSNHFILSAGYSSKNVDRKEGFTYECLVAPCPEQIYNYHYLLGRVMTKLSWEFGKTVSSH